MIFKKPYSKRHFLEMKCPYGFLWRKPCNCVVICASCVLCAQYITEPVLTLWNVYDCRLCNVYRIKTNYTGFYNLIEAQVRTYLLKKMEDMEIFKLVKYNKIIKCLLETLEINHPLINTSWTKDNFWEDNLLEILCMFSWKAFSGWNWWIDFTNVYILKITECRQICKEWYWMCIHNVCSCVLLWHSE